ncbi:class I SAM-dependent DNA methyltransferase [Bosea sp. PAMC 26642]|uniref:class I SAM-dependent DNA methyltransferase n=1 Tax=Bosea sp. (strain PAMC 26642) TaxID=1792307 RepID=UPI001F2BF065|nr:SAM-dependent methyltransferase [Bosea sp. PAMC 26642]
MFASAADPWGFETSPYEQAKYAHTLAVLGGRHYRQGFEIGCANGVLTERLAAHCDTLLAVDVSETALDRARIRCAEQKTIRFARMSFPLAVPAHPEVFDLIVLSEVAYYWDDADLVLAAQRIAGFLAPGGDLILVHWTGETDYPQSGDDAVEALKETLSIDVETLLAERKAEYRLDLWRRTA